MKATQQQQHDLLTLADTDEEIRRLEHKRAHLEEQKVLDQHAETLEKVIDELLEATKTQDNLTVQQTRHEREIEQVDAHRKGSEAKIYSGAVTNEHALEALRKEVKDMQHRKSDLEDSLLEIMEQLEETTSLVDELTARRTELKAQIADLEDRRDHAATDIDAELEQIRARRADEATAVGPDVLGTYDKLRAVRKGRVVARLENRTCNGCHMELTAIELEEIKEEAKTSLASCQQCGSILVVS